MGKIHFRTAFAVIAAVLLSASSCSDDENKIVDPVFTVPSSELEKFPAQGGEYTIAVTSNIYWEAESTVEWARIKMNENDFLVVVDMNIEGERETILTVKADGFQTVNVPLVQAAGFYVKDNQLNFPRSTDEPQTVEINDILDSWDFESDSRWLSAFLSPEGIDVYVNDNMVNQRSGTITITPEFRAPFSITVTQEGIPIDALSMEGTYIATGTVVHESTINPSPTQWECEFELDYDLQKFKITNFGGVEEAVVSLYYSILEDPLSRFTFSWAAGSEESEGLLIWVFMASYFPDMQVPTLHDRIKFIGMPQDNGEDDENFQKYREYVTLEYDPEKEEFKVVGSTYNYKGTDYPVCYGIDIRNAYEGLVTVDYKTAYYKDLVFTKKK